MAIIYKSRGCSTSEIMKLKTLARVVQFVGSVAQLVHGQDVESVGKMRENNGLVSADKTAHSHANLCLTIVFTLTCHCNHIGPFSREPG